jgi:hypothetical protein
VRIPAFLLYAGQYLLLISELRRAPRSAKRMRNSPVLLELQHAIVTIPVNVKFANIISNKNRGFLFRGTRKVKIYRR